MTKSEAVPLPRGFTRCVGFAALELVVLRSSTSDMSGVKASASAEHMKQAWAWQFPVGLCHLCLGFGGCGVKTVRVCRRSWQPGRELNLLGLLEV